MFRLGRLQFAPNALRDSVSIDGHNFPKGTPVLEVHIPAGEALDNNQVTQSLDLAPVFFRQYFNKDYALFHCFSWLLSPALKDILPEGSRIIHFQDRFTVYRTDDERQAEERVFGFLAKDAHAYPENTSLQRELKRYILAGKCVGMGAGVCIAE